MISLGIHFSKSVSIPYFFVNFDLLCTLICWNIQKCLDLKKVKNDFSNALGISICTTVDLLPPFCIEPTLAFFEFFFQISQVADQARKY